MMKRIVVALLAAAVVLALLSGASAQVMDRSLSARSALWIGAETW